MNRRYLLILGTVAFAVLGLWFGFKKSDVLFIRGPASYKDFPQVDYLIENGGDDNMIRQIKLRLLQKMQWVEDGAGWRLKLGAFSLKTQGLTQPTCEHYRQLIIRLVATGVIISSDRPQLTITSDCLEQNQELLLPIISFQQIQNRVQGRTEWQEGDAHFAAELLDDEWFNDWDIREIELVPRHQAPAILIDSIEIQAVRPGAGAITNYM